MSTFTTAVDSSAICTNRFLACCGILSLFGIVVYKTARERFILQGKVAPLIT